MLDGGNLDLLGIFGFKEAAKKKVRHTFGDFESRKQVPGIFWVWSEK